MPLIHHPICNMHVSEIWRYPVKSLKGECLNETEISKFGIPGDRQIAVIRTLNGRFLTSRSRPRLLALQGSINPEGVPTINGHPWDSDEALRLVHDAAGEPVTLERIPAPQAFDVLPLLVATDGAARYLNIDHRRLRPNILLADVPELEERKWPGRVLAIGDVRIHAEKLRDRCVMTTFDPDTQVQDPSVLQRIIRELDGSTALDSSVMAEGKIRVGDPVYIVER
ncbi:MAG TPA: MOSC N-terminal beta barrel domain-containing protein [Candidatus Angelobacter sp.]